MFFVLQKCKTLSPAMVQLTFLQFTCWYFFFKRKIFFHVSAPVLGRCFRTLKTKTSKFYKFFVICMFLWNLLSLFQIFSLIGVYPVLLWWKKSYPPRCAVVFGVEPDLTREGGSIPVTLTFQEATGRNVMLLPVGSSDDGAHSQNEKINRLVTAHTVSLLLKCGTSRNYW